MDSNDKIKMTVTDEMMPWKLLKSHPDLSSQIAPWSGYFSSISQKPAFKTNIEVLPVIPLPVIPHPVTEWSTIYTALKIMSNISHEIIGEKHLTTVSLDLAIYEKAVQLCYCNRFYEMTFNLRLGELHISMAHLRGIGSYVEGSGLELIWMESGVFGVATVRSILSCSHYKRCYYAHEITTIAIFRMLMKQFFLKHPKVKSDFIEIEMEAEPGERHAKTIEFYHCFENIFKGYVDHLKKKPMCKYYLNYLKMYERSQEFIYAT